LTDLLLLLFALWPVIGVLVLSYASRALRARSKGTPLGPASSLTEVLMRMYLWPCLLARMLHGPRAHTD
jgi:hypothetical protein